MLSLKLIYAYKVAPEQYGCHFADGILKCILLNKNYIFIPIPLIVCSTIDIKSSML